MIGNRLLRFRLQAAIHASKLRSGPSGSGAKKIVFIVGTGRSGTHFLARCLAGNAEISDPANGRENPLVFGTITAAAMDQSHSGPKLTQAKRFYDALAALVQPHWLVDQTHPNLWFAEHWSELYPSAKFVGLIRNPFSVVASMMRHAGVREWSLQWQRYPVPNPFLGITEENGARYAEMSLAERCALRWISHYRKLKEVEAALGDRVTTVAYEELCANPEDLLGAVADCLAIPRHFTLPTVDSEALTRGSSMDRADVAAIERLLAEAGTDPRWRNPPW